MSGQDMNRVTFSVVAIMLLAAATTLPFVLNAGFGKAPQGAQLSQVEASPHYRDGQFHNQLPTPGFTGQKNMLAAWWDFLMTKRENARPAQPLPLVKTDLATLPLGQDVMVWLGHSSWYLQLAGKRILIDPVFSDYAAPVTGRVGHSAFHVGTLINPSSGVLVDIVQLDPVRVSFALDEAAFFSKSGQHADIHALKQAWLAQIDVDGKRRDGVLTSIDNRIDARTGSVAVRAEFANPQHRLLPGGSVTILFRPQELQSRVMIPAAAVQQDPQGFFSWVLKPDHTAGQRRLTLAGQQGQQFAVEKGLQAGEQVITDGAQRLREGAAVQVLN
ncbi:TPA: efflux RND transporter periplasmic adaptor subunit [Klebsiella variicola]